MQAVAELAARPQNIETLQSAGTSPPPFRHARGGGAGPGRAPPRGFPRPAAALAAWQRRVPPLQAGR